MESPRSPEPAAIGTTLGDLLRDQHPEVEVWRQAPPSACISCGDLVGAAGFEPTTTSPPDWCATRLRHAPTGGQV
jgi:hypothetical protein